MDTLTHGLYGVTFCSAVGLAGGLTRGHASAGAALRDRTAWWAFAFGVFPDAASLGIPFLLGIAGGVGNFFRQVDGTAMATYHGLHNLAAAFGVVLLTRRIRPGLWIPALAWPLHVLMDAVSHGPGKFQTRLLFPVSDWGFPGINWWEHPWMFRTTSTLLALTWLALWTTRRRVHAKA